MYKKNQLHLLGGENTLKCQNTIYIWEDKAFHSQASQHP